MVSVVELTQELFFKDLPLKKIQIHESIFEADSRSRMIMSEKFQQKKYLNPPILISIFHFKFLFLPFVSAYHSSTKAFYNCLVWNV